jgi:glucose/mannose-6-phosphate isomerase
MHITGYNNLMENSILKFAEQFDYTPEVKNPHKLEDLKKFDNFVLAGMGGSHLAAGILRAYRQKINLYIHRDYGVPEHDENFINKTLYIASSYSGNTEEVVDFLDEAYSKGYATLVISTGGKLIEFAKEYELPYIQIPDTGIQPRLALGFSTIALASIVLPEAIAELHSMKEILKPEDLRPAGETLAKTFSGQIPVIYTSNRNRALGYNWKIKFNETGKTPAFYNMLPELNHNEMQGYDFVEGNSEVAKNIHFVIISDSEDDQRVTNRMNVMEGLLQEKGYNATKIFLEGDSRFERIFKSLLLADWFALYTAKNYEAEPERVPLIEEFKKRIA